MPLDISAKAAEFGSEKTIEIYPLAMSAKTNSP
jgi:hypothetical protein